MLRLKNRYTEKDALVIMGGPSIIENKLDLTQINRDKYTVFLETKALTPKFLEFGLEPDFFLMFFPEKCKDNSLQNFIFRSFLAGFNIAPMLKRECLSVLGEMKENFNKYFESGNIERGPHKKFKWRPDVYLKDSPYDLLRNLANTKIIANGALMKHYFPKFHYPNELYTFEQGKECDNFDLGKYYNPAEENNNILLYCNTFLNSAAIALYPLLKFMGFKKIYLLGMDMSMTGSMEYAAPYTFKSMLHFWWFFQRTKHVFNARYKVNQPYYFRPKSEFVDLKEVTGYKKIKFVRIYNKYKYAAPIEFIDTVSYEDFLNKQN